jgi:serine O-acetyltransferase
MANGEARRWRDRLAADRDRYLGRRSRSWRDGARALWHNPGYGAGFVLRTQELLSSTGRPLSASVLRHLMLFAYGFDSVAGNRIGPGLVMQHPTGIVIGGGARVGAECTILQNVTIGERYGDGRPPHDYPVIGDRVTIGAGACVLGGIHVGNDAVIGANAVVLDDVPARAIVAGAPAKVVGWNIPPDEAQDTADEMR